MGIAIRGNAFPTYGGSQPRLAPHSRPFQRKGRECGAFRVYRHLLPLEGGVRRAEVRGAERSEKGASQVDDLRKHPSAAPRSPFPNGEGLGEATLRVDFYKGRCPKVVFKSWVTSHNNDTSRPLEMEVPQRDFRVWPNPKRRLACPLRRLPVRPNGPRRRLRIECLEEAQLYAAV